MPGQNGEPTMFFFTPLQVFPEEQQKPRASEKAMNNLPIVEITQKHIDEKSFCPICLDTFVKQKEKQNEQNDEKNEGNVVREMPCKHLFCESCLFEWLRQSNTCPLCRFEIESQDASTTTPNVNIQEPSQSQTSPSSETTPPSQTPSSSQTLQTPPPSQTPSSPQAQETPSQPQTRENNVNSSIPTSSSRQSQPRTRYAQHRHPYYSNSHTNYRHSNQLTSCLLERVGCCSERYSLDTTSSLSFRCPSCRAPANLLSDLLKIRTTQQNNDENNSSISGSGSNDNNNNNQVGAGGINYPLTIRLDYMDLD
ncbi:10326_t:CDS:2 [Ambispora leptoticha]|uniref:10326_t:CDS:1 n=1 Tax=Ambispora leptoticha TaxID=144679 RepID=A0A9N9GUS0_9GLOM|nr:10326_t:CDS:2 [Ambispora leptoticha]